uniref:Helicase C-terminal domain-containing protein n=1 Tax=Heterorhabditis bacteriophora TaxID=37862 RepID=A0A1I7WFW8_HETBA
MRSRKIKRTIAKASCGDDGDERRNSSSKWDMGEPTLDDDGAEDSILTTDSQETQATGDQQVVEKILNCRDNIDSGEQQFLIKWKGKAYIHCEWKTLKVETWRKRQRIDKAKIKNQGLRHLSGISSAFLEQFGQCQSDDQVQKLQEILKPMMLRRLKEDVEKSLQPKEETIIEVSTPFFEIILLLTLFLSKRTSAPSLMNVMMELRKCCNHPFLIQGAEETILSELKLLHPEWDDETLAHKALVQASGKVVLIEKLLPKLRKDGHKVLIFSQMVKVLDLLEEFLMNMNYPFERIDGNVRGDLRQASIDRFSKKDSDRFVFLLCTRAGGLGINLTAADTVIIFDSDWNPQNDLQAQARCHRIGQTKMVKVYRLVTANTYEREMFDKASLKLGLDKAVLQSTTALKESSTALSKKDVEELLKKGAYGSIMDENVEEGSKFSEEDIETILQRRTTTITLEAGQKVYFLLRNKKNTHFYLYFSGKNIRYYFYLFHYYICLVATSQNAGRKRRRGDDEDGDYVNYRPDELAFNKSEYFKVEKVLASWGWGRWAEMKKSGELEVWIIFRTILVN